jgi:uncharacterized protein (DUF2235 family)
MKRIALFCDGTWSDLEDGRPDTNVLLLYKSVAPSDGPITQISEYIDGVGAKKNKLTGGIWGKGLDEKILQAYVALCGHYEVGDEIYVFGFSRGAYTARSLVGMLRKCGVMKREELKERAEQAMDLYRKRSAGGPDSAEAQAFRSAHAVAHADNSLVDIPDNLARPEDAARMLRVRYLGIWDTVGALGVPETIPFSAWINQKHRFHDLALSRIVQWARHAMAIDETRNSFEPSPWSQESLIAINSMHREYRVEQDWFSGDHGSVGGGYKERRLADGALIWVAEGAERAGLKFSDQLGYIAAARANYDPINGPLRNSTGGEWLTKLRGQGPRTQAKPQRLIDISEGAVRRMREDPTYVQGDSQEVRWRRTTLANIVRILGL